MGLSLKLNGADVVPLISNGDPCWAQPQHTAAGGGGGGGRLMGPLTFSQQSVCV